MTPEASVAPCPNSMIVPMLPGSSVTEPLPALMLLPVKDMPSAVNWILPPALLIWELAGILICALAPVAEIAILPPLLDTGSEATKLTPAGPVISTAPPELVMLLLTPIVLLLTFVR